VKRGPSWLAEFHRQWLGARGRKAQGPLLAFTRDWEKLLDASGCRTAEDRAAAGREVAALEKEGRLGVVRHRYRHFIERVRLPLGEEGWLRGLFGSEDPVVLQERSLAVVEAARGKGHVIFPELWEGWCARVREDFLTGKGRRPLLWRQPEVTGFLLKVVWQLTSREWRAGTHVRDASVALGLDTKALERHQGAVEAALGGFFGERARVGLEALNLMMTNSVLLFHGPLVLKMPGGVAEPARWLEGAASVSAVDLERAVRLGTTARAVLTVENNKTPFRHAVAANAGGDLLVVASAFPTRAVRLLLEKLPAGLPHYHFGDTDAAGYLILQKLREVVVERPVVAWGMEWRDREGSPALNSYDRRVAGKLLADAGMADVHGDLQRMLEAGRKGDFEQEGREVCRPAGLRDGERAGPAEGTDAGTSAGTDRAGPG
jgi:hypothetical protein